MTITFHRRHEVVWNSEHYDREGATVTLRCRKCGKQVKAEAVRVGRNAWTYERPSRWIAVMPTP